MGLAIGTGFFSPSMMMNRRFSRRTTKTSVFGRHIDIDIDFRLSNYLHFSNTMAGQIPSPPQKKTQRTGHLGALFYY